MRATWIGLILLGLLPAVSFYILEWTGGTDALRFISTTNWQPGDPSMGELLMLALSLAAWIWLRLMLPVFLLASAPFAGADLYRVLRKRRAMGL